MYYIYKDYSRFIDSLTHRLASINILYVKLFQALALNNNLIDDKINNKLLKFTDNVPWTNKDINYEDLHSLKNEYNLSCNMIPMNSGMISVVFKAVERKTGKSMVIKIKRVNIDQTLYDAISNLQWLIFFLSFIPFINKYQFSQLINKNIDIIRQQTNFSEEVDNMSKIKSNCKNLKYIKIPFANKEVTKKYSNIILMEFIEGMKIDNINKPDYENFAKQVIKFGFITTIFHGVTHGDLHGGNILFIKDENDKKYPYKIGIIDFGIIYEVDPAYKDMLFDFIIQLFEVSPRESAIKLLQSGIVGIFEQIPAFHYENIINIITEIIKETMNTPNKATQLQLYKFIIKLKEYLNNDELVHLGIKPSDTFVKIQLILAMSHGVTLSLCNGDFISLADKVIDELFNINLI
jgi:predicted unusual protein kinase regulating ubiquinone biosynthesis (AarF/ABC1/UbiB family)